jgi:hypothetical protein
LASLEFEGAPPDAADLSRRWHAMLDEARDLVRILPADHAGSCVLAPDLTLFRSGRTALESALKGGGIRFHGGSIRGAWPRIRGA